MRPEGRHLVLPLNRPQYVAVPEAFVSALAWNHHVATFEPAPVAGHELAVMYVIPSGSTKTLEYRQTYPTGDGMRRFGEALDGAGVRAEGDQAPLAHAIVNGLRGVRAEGSKAQAAAPVSEATALLQNLAGSSSRSLNPPALGTILETLFSLGVTSSDDNQTASGLWTDAVRRRCEVDPLIRAIDLATADALLSSGPTDVSPAKSLRENIDEARAWRGLLARTPFSWFAEMWSTLTQPQWVEAMPARVWTDWATTVLRMGFGMGYLWEAAWYENIGRALQDSTDRSWEALIDRMEATLPWAPSSAGFSVRDVRSRLAWRTRRSKGLRDSIRSWLKANDANHEPLGDVLGEMAGDEAFVIELQGALSSNAKSSATENLWEAVQYALKIREDSGEFADYFGLLRIHGRRWATLDPGTEWMAVMASLSCGEPGSECDLGQVVESLRDVGLRPQLPDLVALLERAGLARGSADADLGLRVGSAY